MFHFPRLSLLRPGNASEFEAAKRDHRHGSTGWPLVGELLRFNQDTQIMVKLYEKCLMLGQKEKTAIITFFLDVFHRFSSHFIPCLRLPMDRFWAHESHQLCMEVRQV